MISSVPHPPSVRAIITFNFATSSRLIHRRKSIQCPLDNKIVRWNTLTNIAVPVFQFSDEIIVCSLQVEGDLLMVGGMRGELWVLNVRTGKQIISNQRLTLEDNAICNAITIYHTPHGVKRVLVSDNDSFVRNFDYATFNAVIDYRTDWPVNYAVGSHDGRNVLLVGDHADALVLDAHNGVVTHTLHGHSDHSFSAAIRCDDITYATASQDCTTRIWDIRQTKESIHCLSARIAPVRSVKFSSDGSMLVMAEAVDYLHIFDVEQQFQQAQVIDMFGMINGFDLSDDDETLFTGVKDRQYGCIMQYERLQSADDLAEDLYY